MSVTEERIAMIMSMGFDSEDAKRALENTSGSLDRAANMLMLESEAGTNSSSAPPEAVSQETDEANEANVWACRACTVENLNASMKCSLCGTKQCPEGDQHEPQGHNTSHKASEKPPTGVTAQTDSEGSQGQVNSDSAIDMAQPLPSTPVGWACQACTYANIETSQKCELCATERSQAGVQENPAPQIPEDTVCEEAFWACSTCTFNNPEASSKCSVCGVGRTAAQTGIVNHTDTLASLQDNIVRTARHRVAQEERITIGSKLYSPFEDSQFVRQMVEDMGLDPNHPSTQALMQQVCCEA